MPTTDLLTRHAPLAPVDPAGLGAARRSVFARIDGLTLDAAPRRTGRPALRWGLAAASAAALTVAGLTLPSPGDQPAFAGWRAVPTPVDAATLATDAQSCARLLPELTGGALAAPSAQPVEPVLSERRGEYAFTVTRVEGWLRYCLTGPALTFANVYSPDGLSASTGSVGSPDAAPGGTASSLVNTDGLADPAPGTLTLATTGTFTTPAGEQWSTALGRVAPEVTSVRVSLTDGSTVDATAAGGVYAAWWPGAVQPQAVTGVVADGTEVRATDDGWSAALATP